MFNMKKKRLHFLARAAMTLLLVMFATIGARADEGTLSGSGTAADPYLIGSDADWERGCVKTMHPLFFYKQNPDFHKPGLCHVQKNLYL